MGTDSPERGRIPEELIPYLDRYLAAERKELLQGRRHDWFRVNWDGSRLEYRGIDKRIRWQSAKEFGKAFGTHTFRYAIGSTAPQVNPSEPGLAAAVLGISARVLQESYNRAGQAAAAQRFQAMLRADRAATEGIARRAFDDAEARRDASPE